jgi:hypothetical protein
MLTACVKTHRKRRRDEEFLKVLGGLSTRWSSCKDGELPADGSPSLHQPSEILNQKCYFEKENLFNRKCG